MFAYAAHDSYCRRDNLVYDTKAWQFDAGSPVRSSPLDQYNAVYFGDANGDFLPIE